MTAVILMLCSISCSNQKSDDLGLDKVAPLESAYLQADAKEALPILIGMRKEYDSILRGNPNPDFIKFYTAQLAFINARIGMLHELRGEQVEAETYYSEAVGLYSRANDLARSKTSPEVRLMLKQIILIADGDKKVIWIQDYKKAYPQLPIPTDIN